MLMRAAMAVASVNYEVAISARDALYRLILTNVEPVMLGDFSVILQRLAAGWLLIGGGEGDVANLQQLGRSKKNHVGGIVVKRVDQAALVDAGGAESGALRFDGAGHAGRARAYYQKVKRLGTVLL